MQNETTATATTEHTIRLETSSYNDRRYGKPYIATIDFSSDPKGIATWGDWVGQAGDAGMLVIKARTGQVIMRGQKDNRGRNSPPEYGMVEADGSIEWCETKAEAYALSIALAEAKQPEPANPLDGFTLEQLKAEIARRENA